MLFRLQRGKMQKSGSNAISQMVYGKRVDGLIFLYAQEEDPLVQLVADEQFPSSFLGKSLSPFIPLVDNDNVQAGFDATRYFIKGLFTLPSSVVQSLFVTKDAWQFADKRENQAFLDNQHLL